MRKAYQRRLPENPNKDYYYILRETGANTEPILVEYGFIDNTKDATKLKNNLTDYVEGVVKALAEYTNTLYRTPGIETESDYYTVQRGDTLYSIANKYNLSVAQLKSLNNLTSDTLTIGQKLKISQISSEPSTNYETYIIKRGDTLYGIAQQFNTTPDNLKKINNLTSNTLMIGQQLYVPSTTQVVPPTNNETQVDNYIIYEVVKGDSLWLIAKRYNVTVDDIINANDLVTVNLKVGDKLKIPSTETQAKTYIVKNGDSLWSIAKANNISVDLLKNANNLTSNLLSIGQVLVLPN